jgi:Protein of unknown function (DUF2796)
MKALLLPLLPVCFSVATGLAWASKAHQHGVAQLDVAVDPTRVTLELDTPLDNLLGFERAPRTDVERAVVDKALARLREADKLFRIDSAAGCTLDKVTLESPVLGLGAAAAATAAQNKGEHAELNARFEFLCKAGQRASFVEVELFEAFAQLKRINLQLVLPRGQMKATLVRPATRVALAR